MLHLFFLNVLDIDDVHVPPWWIANDYPCWEMIVDRWCSQEWVEMHEAARQRRLLMPGASHHQGNRNLKAYAARYVCELISLF